SEEIIDKKCDKCGEPLREGDSFCPKCGAIQENGGESAEDKTDPDAAKEAAPEKAEAESASEETDNNNDN
ncbi:MAG: zinc ribbon domain-containing protein, partial [Oscillospiraceae bacterium]|nr:zinc ribbon domain-containing protein [Oscillospiraceae bacterium]